MLYLKFLYFHCLSKARIKEEGYGKLVTTSVKHCYIIWHALLQVIGIKSLVVAVVTKVSLENCFKTA